VERVRRVSRSRSPHSRHRTRRSRSPRRRSRSRERDKTTRRKSRSPDSSPEEEEEGEEDERRRRHRKKKDKDKLRKRSSRSRERKERKKEKKDKKKKKLGAVTAQWGQYGIISESDLYTKEEEYRTWLIEERKLNPETMSKDQTKKQFAQFVEDYNTATLPHEKYYDMPAYERRMSILRNGETLPLIDDTYDANKDMLEHSSHHRRPASEKDSFLSKEQLRELRQVQRDRLEAGKLRALGVEVPQTMGVRMDGNEFEE